MLTLCEGTLSAGAVKLLGGLRAETVPDATGAGVFLRCSAEKPADRLVLSAGTIDGLDRFISVYRFVPDVP